MPFEIPVYRSNRDPSTAIVILIIALVVIFIGSILYLMYLGFGFFFPESTALERIGIMLIFACIIYGLKGQDEITYRHS